MPPERAVAAPAVHTPRSTWLRIRPKGSSSTRLEEALVIADRIRRIPVDAGVRIGREARPARWRDMAVLATTNGMLDAIAFALAQAEVPYVVAGKSFFRTREVRDLAAMLALVLDPSDRLAMLEVLRGPWVGAHDETLLGLTRPGEGLAPPFAWTDPPHPELIRVEDRPELAHTSALVAELARCAGRLGPGAILREAVRARGLDEVLAGLPRGEQRVAIAFVIDARFQRSRCASPNPDPTRKPLNRRGESTRTTCREPSQAPRHRRSPQRCSSLPEVARRCVRAGALRIGGCDFFAGRRRRAAADGAREQGVGFPNRVRARDRGSASAVGEGGRSDIARRW